MVFTTETHSFTVSILWTAKLKKPTAGFKINGNCNSETGKSFNFFNGIPLKKYSGKASLINSLF